MKPKQVRNSVKQGIKSGAIGAVLVLFMMPLAQANFFDSAFHKVTDALKKADDATYHIGSTTAHEFTKGFENVGKGIYDGGDALLHGDIQEVGKGLVKTTKGVFQVMTMYVNNAMMPDFTVVGGALNNTKAFLEEGVFDGAMVDAVDLNFKDMDDDLKDSLIKHAKDMQYIGGVGEVRRQKEAIKPKELAKGTGKFVWNTLKLPGYLLTGQVKLAQKSGEEAWIGLKDAYESGLLDVIADILVVVPVLGASAREVTVVLGRVRMAMREARLAVKAARAAKGTHQSIVKANQELAEASKEIENARGTIARAEAAEANIEETMTSGKVKEQLAKAPKAQQEQAGEVDAALGEHKSTRIAATSEIAQMEKEQQVLTTELGTLETTTVRSSMADDTIARLTDGNFFAHTKEANFDIVLMRNRVGAIERENVFLNDMMKEMSKPNFNTKLLVRKSGGPYPQRIDASINNAKLLVKESNEQYQNVERVVNDMQASYLQRQNTMTAAERKLAEANIKAGNAHVKQFKAQAQRAEKAFKKTDATYDRAILLKTKVGHAWEYDRTLAQVENQLTVNNQHETRKFLRRLKKLKEMSLKRERDAKRILQLNKKGVRVKEKPDLRLKLAERDAPDFTRRYKQLHEAIKKIEKKLATMPPQQKVMASGLKNAETQAVRSAEQSEVIKNISNPHVFGSNTNFDIVRMRRYATEVRAQTELLDSSLAEINQSGYDIRTLQKTGRDSFSQTVDDIYSQAQRSVEQARMQYRRAANAVTDLRRGYLDSKPIMTAEERSIAQSNWRGGRELVEDLGEEMRLIDNELSQAHKAYDRVLTRKNELISKIAH